MVNPVERRWIGILVVAFILTAFGGLSFSQETPEEVQGSSRGADRDADRGR